MEHSYEKLKGCMEYDAQGEAVLDLRRKRLYNNKINNKKNIYIALILFSSKRLDSPGYLMQSLN